MQMTNRLLIQGIPENTPESIAALCRSRILSAVGDLVDKTGIGDVRILVGTQAKNQNGNFKAGSSPSSKIRSEAISEEQQSEDKLKSLQARQPLYRFDQLIVSDQVREEILVAVDIIRVGAKVFGEWGLREIEPFPSTALNFYGPPGTGKTLAAHAIAHKLKRKILAASYAEIESKYHGDGPKNVKAIFNVAVESGAVLFIDEADSLLSKRLTNVTQGSEQAINSMRSQLLLSLQQFYGVVIFATNLIENYDKAFETRVRHVRFPLPDEKCRYAIWRAHLPEKLPLASDVSLDSLAKIEDLCGRDIKNAVIDAAVRVARNGRAFITLKDLIDAAERVKNARIEVPPRGMKKLEGEEAAKVRDLLRDALDKPQSAAG